MRFAPETIALLMTTTAASAAPFHEDTARWLGSVPTDGWSNKIELCDVDGDGDVDAFVANGAAYSEAADPELPYFWRNAGDHFEDASLELPVPAGWWRAVKCADVDNDGDEDVFFAGTFQSFSFLLENVGGGRFVDRSDRLPRERHSFGDAEFADVDGDLDLDLVLADWGPGDPLDSAAPPRLWMNDGGAFVDGSDRLPPVRAGFSWDLEAVDVDNDLDLDLVVACKSCRDGGLLLTNDLMQGGRGVFSDESAGLPGDGNNYDFEVLDVDGDKDLDLFTVNDGENLSERLLENVGGTFVEKASAFAPGVNGGDDDNAALVVDADGDGDEDVVIASLSGDDRVLENDGGVFVRRTVATDGDRTRGSLSFAAADLDGDGRLDLVMGQGENAFADLVYVGDDIAVDDEAPSLWTPAVDRARGRLLVRAHDHVTPVRTGDLVVTAAIDGAQPRTVTLARAGELYWQAAVVDGDESAVVCAEDRRGHSVCSSAVSLAAASGGSEGEGEPGDGGSEGEGEPAAHGGDVGGVDDVDDDAVTATSCQLTSFAAPPVLLLVLVLRPGPRRRRPFWRIP